MGIPVSFEPHFFPWIRLEANPDYRQSESAHDVIVDSKISAKVAPDSATRFFCELRVKVDREANLNAPYYMDIVCIVFIAVDNEVPEEERKKTATLYAHIMLFPAVRELVLYLTARQPWGQFSIGLANLQPEKPLVEEEKPGRKHRKPRGKAIAKTEKTVR